MTAPVRLQLSRRKGFHLQGLSIRTNGLPAVVVSRTRGAGGWGNPYRIGDPHPRTGRPMTRAQAIALFRKRWAPYADVIRERLAGKNLACFCKPTQACHADVLLELANPKGD